VKAKVGLVEKGQEKPMAEPYMEDRAEAKVEAKVGTLAKVEKEQANCDS
jgi:hypothetical protein